ncbi:Uu.00g125970.m01.CDS01 [Anthostomella pinea]|uniref:Uu.00g125970.m01.CDS01 n=1 Tax=Anthostomella pinea TaxID=933095 RepID=A0AAI8YFB9_9PEZI|nr:Uu.00g125970.m01.CDS01 [Anthostomella pinea]
MAAGAATHPGGGGTDGANSDSGKAPFRHIDDLTSVGVDLDPHTPLRKMLEIGDAHMRQATTFNDFRRPDLALQEYIKAFIIAVDRVPKHKEYPSLKADRGDLNRLYTALKSKISASTTTFEQIKSNIQDDNRRSGVCSTRSALNSSKPSSMNLPSPPSGHLMQDSNQAAGDSRLNGSSREGDGLFSPARKNKPAVHPKPQALHGKAVGHVSDMAPQDLAARFAKLRECHGPHKVGAAADPTKHAGLGDMTKYYGPRSPVDRSIPVLPKLPDAIYNPARGTVTSELANLPSSTPRGMFSRTNSMASGPSASSRTSMENAIRSFSEEQFVTAHTYEAPRLSSRPQPTGIRVPEGNTITVNDLIGYMRQGSATIRILIIDVRDRDSYNEGHIMSQRTICIEPEILSRGNISAGQIVDSMVLAPPQEESAIKQLDEVDLVVVYDQDSTRVPTRLSGDTEEIVLYNIWQALSQYNYDRALKNPPKLLVGGLDAWVDELGAQSLGTSSTPTSAKPANWGSARHHGGRRRSRNTITLPQDESERWEATIKKEQTLEYIKSKKDFHAKFPSVSRLPESMSSSTRPRQAKRMAEAREEDFLETIAPNPPRLPKRSVAKTRYSGLESEDDASPVGGITMMADSSQAATTQKRTGLRNPTNWCYSNATLQAILASHGFVDEMLDERWPANHRSMAGPSHVRHAQLMCKVLGNLMQWMSKKHFDTMQATTFMHYIRAIHRGYLSGDGQWMRFGDRSQHDAEELITFVFDQLAGETNMAHLHAPLEDPSPDIANNRVHSLVHFWNTTIRQRDDIVLRYWADVSMAVLTCKACGKVTNTPIVEEVCGFPAVKGRKDASLLGDLKALTKGDEVEYNCLCGGLGDKDKKGVYQGVPADHHKQSQFVRLPPLLRVCLYRYDYGSPDKLVTHYDFPINDLDLREYTMEEKDREAVKKALGSNGDGFAGTTSYDLYAVIVHQGARLATGHYWTYVRTGASEWTKCDDARITPTGIDEKELHRRLTQNYLPSEPTDKNPTPPTPTMMFYKRKDVPWSWDVKKK